MDIIVAYPIALACYAAGNLVSRYLYVYLKEIVFVCAMYQRVGNVVNIFGGNTFSVIMDLFVFGVEKKSQENKKWLYWSRIVVVLIMLFLTGMYTAGNVEAKIDAMEIKVGDVREAEELSSLNLNIRYLNPYGVAISISDIHGKIEIINVEWDDEVSTGYIIRNLLPFCMMKKRMGRDFESATFTVRPLESSKVTIESADPVVHISANSEENWLYKKDPGLKLGKIRYQKVGGTEIVERDVPDSSFEIPAGEGDAYWVEYERDWEQGKAPRLVNAGETMNCFYYGDTLRLDEEELQRLFGQAFPTLEEAKITNINFCQRNPEIYQENPEMIKNYHLDDGDFWVKCGKDVVYSCYLKEEDARSPCYMAELLGQRSGEDVRVQWSRADRDEAWVEVEVTFE